VASGCVAGSKEWDWRRSEDEHELDVDGLWWQGELGAAAFVDGVSGEEVP
jgi:hypothetical protein